MKSGNVVTRAQSGTTPKPVPRGNTNTGIVGRASSDKTGKSSKMYDTAAAKQKVR